MIKNKSLKRIIEMILEQIDRLPNPPRESIKQELHKIQELIMESRAPKFMVCGRRGAGKSSLINAIFQEKVASIGSVLSETGEPTWYKCKSNKGEIEILDTRGLGDRTKPESANFQDSIQEIKFSLENEHPDVILFLCKAQDVDSHIKNDIEYINEVRDFLNKKHMYNIPIVSIITKVDELDPLSVNQPPYDNEKKQNNINTAIKAMGDVFNSFDIELMKIIPISAYAEYEDNKITSKRYWNIDLLVEYLIEVLPNSAQLELARLAKVKSVQIKMARVLIGSTATICSGIAATPIPIADILPITSAQIGMIIGIAYISGKELSKDSAKDFFVALGINVGGAFLLREAARALVKFVFPGAGNVISAGMAFAGTWGIGEVAISYFIEGQSIEKAKERLSKVIKEKLDKIKD